MLFTNKPLIRKNCDLLMCDGEGENAIMATINRVEGFHGTEHRGATGDDVIYEQNVFLTQVVGVVNAKNLGQLTAVG